MDIKFVAKNSTGVENATIVCRYNTLYGGFTFSSSEPANYIKKVLRKKQGEEEIYTIFDVNTNTTQNFTDFTCENGSYYSYTVVVGDNSTEYSFYLDTKPMIEFKVEFDDIVLLDANSSFLVRFNPSISNLKINQNDSIIQTLGSRYPIVRHNSLTRYYSFSLGGLISLRAENDLGLLPQRQEDDEILYERSYRNEFVNKLADGRIKMFKSPTEGVMLVRITDVNLTPEQGLGRKIYSFSAQVTEVAAADISNFSNYNIFSNMAALPFITNTGKPFYVTLV